MTIISKLALSAALAFGAVTCAQAATEYTTFDLVNSTENVPGVYTGTYAINSITGASPTDLFGNPVAALVAGDFFVDDFVFTIQDDQYVSFYAVSTFNPIPTALFQSVTLYDFVGGVYSPIDSIDSPISLFEDGFALHSGAYALEITGQLLANGGGFNGVLTTTPVPEPSSLALMLAGVGAMFSLARRRKNHQA